MSSVQPTDTEGEGPIVRERRSPSLQAFPVHTRFRMSMPFRIIPGKLVLWPGVSGATPQRDGACDADTASDWCV